MKRDATRRRDERKERRGRDFHAKRERSYNDALVKSGTVTVSYSSASYRADIEIQVGLTAALLRFNARRSISPPLFTSSPLHRFTAPSRRASWYLTRAHFAFSLRLRNYTEFFPPPLLPSPTGDKVETQVCSFEASKRIRKKLFPLREWDVNFRLDSLDFRQKISFIE